MSDSDQYLWVHDKDGYRRLFYLKLDQAPYYIGNENFELLNFRPSDTEANTWSGDRDGLELTLVVVDDEEYLMTEYPESLRLKQVYQVEFALLEMNGKPSSSELYLIATLNQGQRINQELKHKKHNCTIL